PAGDILDIAVSHAGVPWTQSRTKNRVELGDASEDRMVAGATVVPGIGAEARAFLATEQRHHGRIDVHGDCIELGARDGSQALLGHETLQCLDGVLVEAGEILVDGVDAWDGASGEVLENWVWRQAFEVEHALCAGCSRIDQQLQLGVHGIDDPVPLLEPSEAPAQLAPDTLLLQECVEGDQASDTGQRAIVGPLPQAPRVRPADALLLFLPLVPRRPLASEPSSAHLLGARGAWYLLSHQPRRTGDSGAKFPLFARTSRGQPLARPTRWSEIQAEAQVVRDAVGVRGAVGWHTPAPPIALTDGVFAAIGVRGAPVGTGRSEGTDEPISG